ncbi:hypothetical protein ACGFNU_05840 [Spirillospora sp. NPDC048911]|uniref:hypothetical protein n=1 Tax=Spirillospora sp. NPDC048911 TaxID=3364527 RepID=UPI0037243869
MRTVSVLLRRAAGSRLVRRLLVLAGIAVTGWLIGGTAQAHADDAPVALTPVVSEIMRAAHPEHTGPVRHASKGVVAGDADDVHGAVRGVPGAAQDVPGAAKAVHRKAKAVPGAAETVPGAADGVPGAADGVPGAAQGVLRPGHVSAAQPDLSLPVPSQDVVGQADGALEDLTGPKVTDHSATDGSEQCVADASHGGRQGLRLPAATAGVLKASAKSGSAVSHATVTSPAPAPAPGSPLHAPAQAGTAVPASGAAPLAGLGGLFGRWSWNAALRRPVLMPAYGAVPPAIRTAADEPTFSPD